MSSSNQPPSSRRDDIALQFMLTMSSDTALSPDAMATRAFALADAFNEKRYVPAPATLPSPIASKPFDKALADEIPF